MKKTLLKIAIDNNGIDTYICCDDIEELSQLCVSLILAMERNEKLANAFMAALKIRLQYPDNEIVKAYFEGIDLPDFDEILKKAKIDPNQNIKEN